MESNYTTGTYWRYLSSWQRGSATEDIACAARDTAKSSGALRTVAALFGPLVSSEVRLMMLECSAFLYVAIQD